MATLLIRRYAVALGTGPSEPSPVQLLEPWYRTYEDAAAAAEMFNAKARAGLLDVVLAPGLTFYVRPDRTGLTVPDNVSTEELLAAAAAQKANVETFIRLQGVAGGSYVGAIQAAELLRLMREKP